MGILDIMSISFGEILFLSFIALFPFVNLIKFCYFYRKLFRLLDEQPEEKFKLSSVNKYKLIFSKDWFKNEEFEYRRVQAREALKTTIVFAIGLTVVFLIFAFYGLK